MNAKPKVKTASKSIRWLLVLFLFFPSLGYSEKEHASSRLVQSFPKEPAAYNTRQILFQELNARIGNRDALLIAGPDGNILFSKNADKNLVPASTLKILTVLVALHYLGPDYRFQTEFYLDPNLNLKVKGYGDPLFISEVFPEVANRLKEKVESFNNLVLDDSYFSCPIIIPGVCPSSQPYDSPNGALCANFNTIHINRIGSVFVSDEPQTPLLPFALDLIKKSEKTQGRIILSHHQDEIALYTGHLLLHFFKEKGRKSTGDLRIGRVQEEKDRLVFQYLSKFTLKQIISKLLEYSNNFMANQILIAAGVKACGPPGTLEKGIRTALTYASDVLDAENLVLAEGSGISRKNRVSVRTMKKILDRFEVYHYLMKHCGKEFYKTGTLKGIRTRAGFIENEKGERYRFALFVNSPEKTTHRIMNAVYRIVETTGGRDSISIYPKADL